ncbi:hypothetical protein BDY19DRAFT_905346 [Irpex rosettiformis]|uniref:Uncharacterized protein n=1 Tax=Irpex rosettiformis TaxID=378272 RepID=A0ACB8U842_9APHY|nr:hypothetical protein BDY19DRAFT_905346 [Irpex rosettiformis]
MDREERPQESGLNTVLADSAQRRLLSTPLLGSELKRCRCCSLQETIGPWGNRITPSSADGDVAQCHTCTQLPIVDGSIPRTNFSSCSAIDVYANTSNRATSTSFAGLLLGLNLVPKILIQTRQHIAIRDRNPRRAAEISCDEFPKLEVCVASHTIRCTQARTQNVSHGPIEIGSVSSVVVW